MGTQEAATIRGLNEAIIQGQLVALPEVRVLPSGSHAHSFSLTVRSPEMKTTSVPLVWYNAPKRVGLWQVGDRVIVRGAVIRRFFRGGGGLGSATEVVVEGAELVRHVRKTQRLVDRWRLGLEGVMSADVQKT